MTRVLLTRKEITVKEYTLAIEVDEQEHLSVEAIAKIKAECGSISHVLDKEGVTLLDKHIKQSSEIEKTQPLYEHDCDNCVYLGSYLDEFDLYYCPSKPTVTARYGSLDLYQSGMVFTYGENKIEELVEARRRAEELGLLEGEK